MLKLIIYSIEPRLRFEQIYVGILSTAFVGLVNGNGEAIFNVKMSVSSGPLGAKLKTVFLWPSTSYFETRSSM